MVEWVIRDGSADRCWDKILFFLCVENVEVNWKPGICRRNGMFLIVPKEGGTMVNRAKLDG